MSNELFLDVSSGRVFVCKLGSGQHSALYGPSFQTEGATSKQALSTLAEYLKLASDEIFALSLAAKD